MKISHHLELAIDVFHGVLHAIFLTFFPTSKFDFYGTFLTSLTINLAHPLGM